MRFYTKQHKFYCGIDLRAKSMYLCILDQAGNVVLHRNIRTKPEKFLSTISRYREDIVVAVECMFTWYWIADADSYFRIRSIPEVGRILGTISTVSPGYRTLSPIVSASENRKPRQNRLIS